MGILCPDGKMSSKQFKRIRLQLGLKQAQLAEELGCRVETISRYENGREPVSRSKENAIKNLLKLQQYREGAA